MHKLLTLTILLSTFTALIKAQPLFLTPSNNQSSVQVIEDRDSYSIRPDFLPRITHTVNAKHTYEAFEKAISGKVILKAVLSAEGKVTDIQVIKGLPDGLTEKAIQAAQKIKFDPALKAGKPVPYQVTLVYPFYHPGLDVKRIKEILRKENPWLSENASILIANQLYRVSGINYYEVIQFAPELIKSGVDSLTPSDRQEYLDLLNTMTRSLQLSEQQILQQFPFRSGKEVLAEDRQKSNAALRKAWDQLSSSQQQRWRELHNQVVEYSLFRRRVTK